mgnify:CR=1 FL=1|tara:strand:- start:10082 stop:11068 length:987 start_codon:yes stop_codon:yes gene_type:complete
MKYLGNKNRLSDFLSHNMGLKSRGNARALDLFCGTGAVSLLFKSHGINTVSNDFLSFSAHRTRSILLDRAPSRQHAIEHNISHGFITKNYSESSGVNIFKTDIAKHIDGARLWIDKMSKQLTPQEFSYYLAQIIEAADFRSNIMGSYESYYKAGWRRQCEKPWQVKDFELVDMHNSTKHIVHNDDAYQFLQNNVDSYDLIYLDPPYNSRQYSSVFHVLETISKYNNPAVKGVVRKSIETSDKKSKLSSKRNCHSEMTRIIDLCSEKTNELFVSYSNEGIMQPSELEEMIGLKFKNTMVHELDYRRFKTNSRKQNGNNKVKEYLFHGIK